MQTFREVLTVNVAGMAMLIICSAILTTVVQAENIVDTNESISLLPHSPTKAASLLVAHQSPVSMLPSSNGVSLSRGITRGPVHHPSQTDPIRGDGNIYRTYQGHDNHLTEVDMGKANTDLVRWMPASYADQISHPWGDSMPSARLISNEVFDQAFSQPNVINASDYLWQWGQFLDHDIDLTDGMDPLEPMPIAVPMGDVYFDPDATGTMNIPFNRSIYNMATGDSIDNPRLQINEISSWIDASNVYGSSGLRALALRTLDGTGQLKTSAGNLLPFNLDQLPNAGGSGSHLFVAGDVRANEQAGLTALHTLFLREHNRLATTIAQQNPSFSGETIYQTARRIVGGIMQFITYNEFLPVLLGAEALPEYAGYDDQLNSGISAVFSTSAYRFGHSALSPVIRRTLADGQTYVDGHLALRDAFFAPHILSEPGSLEAILRGLGTQVCQSIDALVIDDLRNFLFGAPGAGGLDLVSLNIQRSRDHGLQSYTSLRQQLNLVGVNSFAQVTSDPQLQQKLQLTYGEIESMDAWVGGLAEDHVPGALIGELFFTIIKKQFQLLRDGDRFWYQNYLSTAEQALVESSSLANVIRRNTVIDQEISDTVFFVDNLQDSDADFVEDIRDNCLLISNASQTDTDNDGYGNACDTDLNNDGHTNFIDLMLFANNYLTADADSDFNGDGFVNALDLAIFRDFFLQRVGPSGLHY